MRSKLWREVVPKPANSTAREFARIDNDKINLQEYFDDVFVFIVSGSWLLLKEGKIIGTKSFYGRRINNPPFTWANKILRDNLGKK